MKGKSDKVGAKRVGLYLGVQPSAGGMFQYAQCLLQSLVNISQAGALEVVIAYGDPRWKPIIDPLHLPSVRLRHWAAGTFLARVLMSLLVPTGLARLLSRWVNPLVYELRELQCDIFIFPAQDELTWQVDEPVIGTIHDLMHRYERTFPEAGNWWRYYLREHRFRNIARQSAAILVDSELGKRHVMESYAARSERVHALPYIAPGHIHGDSERPDFDSLYQLPTKFYFYPAQFWRHKNHLRLINALLEARKTCGDMALVLAGGFRHEYALVHEQVLKVGLSDAVRFVGYVPDADVAGFYRRARGLVMPTFFGPTNIPPLEAMAMGCPVLSSGTYAMPEQCGDAALYFDPNSVEEIRDQMIRLWSDDRLYEQLSACGLKRTQVWGQLQFGQRLGDVLSDVFR